MKGKTIRPKTINADKRSESVGDMSDELKQTYI